MLIEINLLPTKERGNSVLLFASGIFGVLLFIIIAFFLWKNHSLTSEMKTLNKEITVTEQIVAIEQDKLKTFESANSKLQLEKSIQWANTYPIEAVPVMRKLTALLPDRGFIQTFSYDEIGNIILTVQFDTSREAAYYLSRLVQSEWVEQADVNTLISQADKNETEESTENEPEYMPRYLAEFQIKLDKAMVRQPSEENAEDSLPFEEVNGS